MSSSEYQSRKLVLPSASEAESSATTLAESNNWPKVAEVPADPESGTLRKVVWQLTPDAQLTFIVDDATGVPYVYVTADTPDTANSLSEEVAASLHALKYADVVEKYDRATGPDERAGSLLLVALAAPPGDKSSFERIMSALKSPDPGLREAAIYASTYNPSSRYRRQLTEIARQDPVEDLQNDAIDVLAAYDEVGVD